MYRKALIGTAAGVLIWGLYKLSNDPMAEPDQRTPDVAGARTRARRRASRPALEEARDAFDERMRDLMRRKAA
jgi:hypothetical protein